MSPLAESLIVAACVFAGGMIGLQLRRFVPEAHMSRETQDVVRLTTGMISVLASLVLGLLISSAKATSDNLDHEMRDFSANLIRLDEILRDYGNDATAPRALLRQYTAQALEDHWPTDAARPAATDNDATGKLLERVRERIRALRPVDAGQSDLQKEALALNATLLGARWLLIVNEGPSVRPLVLGILVAWIFLIFASFGLNAPTHATVIAAFLIGAAAIGGAVFLILELDTPFAGFLRISPTPMQIALAHMGAAPP